MLGNPSTAGSLPPNPSAAGPRTPRSSWRRRPGRSLKSTPPLSRLERTRSPPRSTARRAAVRSAKASGWAARRARLDTDAIVVKGPSPRDEQSSSAESLAWSLPPPDPYPSVSRKHDRSATSHCTQPSRSTRFHSQGSSSWCPRLLGARSGEDASVRRPVRGPLLLPRWLERARLAVDLCVSSRTRWRLRLAKARPRP